MMRELAFDPSSPAPPARAAASPAPSRGCGLWSSGVVLLTLADGAYRTGLRALYTVERGLTRGEWLALAASVVLFTFGEGHAVLARRFAPAVVARAFSSTAPNGRAALVLGPLHALALARVTWREALRNWAVLAVIAGAIHAVRALPEPWRGVVDAGVFAALLWGSLALVAVAGRAALAKARPR
ncbi:MAG TPA: hypothetical protein VMI54_05460 [Polyangiaceae bacterium]|nr:hypothetical protein [Polyangiaceae bacterium]